MRRSCHAVCRGSPRALGVAGVRLRRRFVFGVRTRRRATTSRWRPATTSSSTARPSRCGISTPTVPSTSSSAPWSARDPPPHHPHALRRRRARPPPRFLRRPVQGPTALTGDGARPSGSVPSGTWSSGAPREAESSLRIRRRGGRRRRCANARGSSRRSRFDLRALAKDLTSAAVGARLRSVARCALAGLFD